MCRKKTKHTLFELFAKDLLQSGRTRYSFTNFKIVTTKCDKKIVTKCDSYKM